MSKTRNVVERELYEAIALPAASRSMTLLDFGCGDGTHMEIFKELGIQEVYGLDVFEKYRGENIEIDPDSIAYLQRHQGAYDVIFARESLYYLARDRQADLFKALYGALKPDGKLVAICFNGVLTTSNYIYQKDFGMKVVFNEISIRELAEEAGFEKLEILGVKSRARTSMGQFAVNLLDWAVRVRCSTIHFLERRRDPFFPQVFTRSVALIAERGR